MGVYRRREDAPIDTSWGTTLDVNGDGYADVAVGAPSGGVTAAHPGNVHVYLGGTSGIAASPSVTLADPRASIGESFGLAVTSAGDVDGDGFGDLLVTAPASGFGALPEGEVYVYLGSRTGIADAPSITLGAPAWALRAATRASAPPLLGRETSMAMDTPTSSSPSKATALASTLVARAVPRRPPPPRSPSRGATMATSVVLSRRQATSTATDTPTSS